MTVSYTAEVATSRGFGCFLKLLFRWKGSIYKLVWPDLLLFLAIYYALSLIYRFALDEGQRSTFEKIAVYCENSSNLIPLSFVLGFYVSIVVGRWWSQYTSIPWPDTTAVYVNASIVGEDDRARLMRRTIMRYVCLCLTMVFTMVSPRVKKRFPTLDHLVEAGLLNENEKVILDDLNRNVPGYSKQWVPIVWATTIVTRARREGRIRDDFAVKTILDALNKFRGDSGMLISYDWISVPLVYTQVVTLAVYSFFLACLMGRQFVASKVDSAYHHMSEYDLIFPLFTLLQFFFYMGWLKVAESLVNPFGDDDDDFELNWLIDRNLQVCYLIVDEMHHDHPELVKDQYWDEVFPAELPYTVATEHYRREPPASSTAHIEIPDEEQDIVVQSKVNETYEGPDGTPVTIQRTVSRLSRVGSRLLDHPDRRGSIRSTSSRSTIASSTGRLNRGHSGSLVSMFKRAFSRERGSEDRGGSRIELGTSPSSANLPNRIINVDETIPEADENAATVVSMRAEPRKPTVQEVFGSVASDTVDADAAATKTNNLHMDLPIVSGPYLGLDGLPDIDDDSDHDFYENRFSTQLSGEKVPQPKRNTKRFTIGLRQSESEQEANQKLLDESATSTSDAQNAEKDSSDKD